MTDATTQPPAASSATTPAAVTSSVAPSPAPAAIARPEFLPEAYWDTTANSIKPEFGQHYTEIATAHRTETERQAVLAARKPEDIKFEVKLPETIKIPEGMDLKINDNDPRVPVIREMAIKRGWDQDTVNELVALDAQQQIAAHAAEQTRIAAADAKLGANATARKTAVGDWLKGLKDNNKLSGAEYEAVRVYATDAETVTALEKIMAMASGTVPGHVPGNPPPPAQVPQAERWYGATTPKKVS